MPSFPAELVNWLQPGAIGAGFAVVWTEIRSLHRRVDDLREDMKEGFAQSRAEYKEDIAQCRAEMREGFAQSRAEYKEGFAQSRADIRALNEKLDRLVEASLTARQA